jgi:hypothetical protein
MNTAKLMSATGLGVPTGPWRWAALGFVLLALAAAGLTIAAPQVAGLAGYAILGGIALLAVLFLVAVWPRSGRAAEDAWRWRASPAPPFCTACRAMPPKGAPAKNRLW